MRGAGVIDGLRELLTQPLPGLGAQAHMAPVERVRRAALDPPADAREGAVLILLYPGAEEWQVPLILRPVYEGVHSGQVALPGGKAEPEDKDLVDTALRETEEEIGVARDSIEVLGSLSRLYIPPSNFLVNPVVGFVRELPAFRPDPTEVSGVIEAPVRHFLEDAYRAEKDILVRGTMRIKVPCFVIGGHVVWGATAMMMSEFSEIIRRLNP